MLLLVFSKFNYEYPAVWIWRLCDNIVNQYIDGVCIIYSENHMGGRQEKSLLAAIYDGVGEK